MPYPPAVPPATRTNATPEVDSHPSDHNAISEALTEILNHVAGVDDTLSALTPPWVPLPLTNGWVNNSFGGRPPGEYRRIGDIVYIRGCIANPTPVAPPPAQALFATLPVGFRSTYLQALPTVISAASGYPVLGIVNVYANGDLAVAAVQASDTPHNYTLFTTSFAVN